METINKKYMNIDSLLTLFKGRIPETPAIQRYMPNYINGIAGWHFSKDEITQANKQDKLMTLDFEIPSVCSLRCLYCFRYEDERSIAKKWLKWDEWTQVIDQCAELGLKTIKIIGDGEFTQNKLFFKHIKYITDRNILPLVFTSGYVIGNDDLAKKIHGINGEEMVDKLYDLEASVIIKMDSIDHTLQDKIANREGYAATRDKALLMLYDKGFASSCPTRLGVEVLVGPYNFEELSTIYMLKPIFNIYVDLLVTMPCGNYFKNESDVDIPLSKKLELYNTIYSINKEWDVPFEGISPFIGGLMCSQLGYGLYANSCGEIFTCPGSFESMGNVRHVSIKSVWNHHKLKEEYRKGSHPCIYREQYDILPKNLEELVEVSNEGP